MDRGCGSISPFEPPNLRPVALLLLLDYPMEIRYLDDRSFEFMEDFMRNLGFHNIWQYSGLIFLLSLILLILGTAWMGVSFAFGEWINGMHPYLRSSHVFFETLSDFTYYVLIAKLSVVISALLSFFILFAVSITKMYLGPLIPSA